MDGPSPPISGEANLEVQAWEDTITLPTYEEGLPDVNPPFDLFRGRSFLTYPYTTRETMTDRKSLKEWRTLNLENEYLRVTVLPDLGGRLYRCIDKANGLEMFYANPSIKYAQVAYRGAWVALGIEFNFPVSHNWVTVSPVDFRIDRGADGSAAIWVGNVDRVYGMQWRVALRLAPGSSLLEQTISLYNRSSLRRPFYWWTNCSVRVWDDSRIIYPMRYSAGHGFSDVDTWPVDSSGADLSIPGNHRRGFVSRFSHASREPFMGIYHPQTESGMIHFASFDEVPAKKIWSWGWDEEGRDWHRALSDDGSAYVEVQAGLFPNQETYAFLEPHQFLRFHEFYMPVRGIGGFSRANLHGVVHIRRENGPAAKGALRVGVNVNREIFGGMIRIKREGEVVSRFLLDLKPSQVFEQICHGLTHEGTYTVELVDGNGSILLAHTENQYDFLSEPQVVTGPRSPCSISPIENRSEGDFIGLGQQQELNGRLLRASDTCQEGIERFPWSYGLNKAAGRLALQLKRHEEAAERLSMARAQHGRDPEAMYYLGLAWLALGTCGRARTEWQNIPPTSPFHPAALIQLAFLSAQQNDLLDALRQTQEAIARSPKMIRAGCAEVALLRGIGDQALADKRLAAWLQLDPPNSFLRFEGVRLGRVDDGLWRHLAGDPERVLEIAVDYMALGFYDDALELLSREYPSDGVYSEPGAVLPQDYPLVAYYRGYCRRQLGSDGRADLEMASRQSIRYVFPNRSETIEVLHSALSINPQDSNAHFLLGSLYLSRGDADRALREWKQAEAMNPGIPVLHRNMGFAILHSKADPAEAMRYFISGLDYDPSNVDLYLGIDACMSLLDRDADARIRALLRYPNPAEMPPVLVHKLALAYVEAGRPRESDKLFRNRFFPREEFGTSVRLVYLEVQLQKALVLARAGMNGEAADAAAAIGEVVPDLPFTHGGLKMYIESPRFQFYLGLLQALCGCSHLARLYWSKAAGASSYQQVYFGYLAAQHLGDVDHQAWRNRLESALAETGSSMAEDYHVPGLVTCARGLIFLALDRRGEADRCFRRSFFLPDKGMSHYLSRIALRDSLT